LYDLLKPHVTKLMVCDPRKNSRQGNKNDRIDARERADRLYMNKLSSVYHGGAGVRTLKELARSYLTISNRGAGHGKITSRESRYRVRRIEICDNCCGTVIGWCRCARGS